MAISDDIIDKVERKILDTSRLRERMDDDYNLWNLRTYEGMEAGYEVFTSNEPKTFARKAIAILGGASMTIRCPQNNDPREGREQDNAKEQFAIGNLKSNDERLVRMGMVPLRRAMSFHLLIRGYTAGRCVLSNREGRVWADATPWDPREVTWEYGSEGLAWMCRRYAVIRMAVEDEWKLPRSDKSMEDQVLMVYDYYDEEKNIVVIPDAKDTPVKNERHGMTDGYGIPRVPGWVIANPLQPPVQSVDMTTGGSFESSQMGDMLAEYGESIFSEDREIWETHNFNMSVMKNLVSRSLKPVFGIRSRDGVKLVEGDPFRSGAEIPLADGEELIVYDFLRSAPDLIPYMTVVQGEMQRGAFPVIMHGETPAAISGFAMSLLKSGPADKVLSAAEAEELAIKSITNMWCDQFVSGAFGQGGMQLSGQGGNRKWFVANITPDMIRELPELEITLRPQLPEDDAAKIQLANALRTPGPTGVPLMSDYDIRESYLDRQDSDQDMDTILQEMASMHPLVQAHRFADALAKRGDEGAQYWQAQWMQMVQQMMQQGLQIPDIKPPEGASQPGFSPQVLPNAAQGIPGPTPGVDTPFQSGPMVPPGTPRPGALGPNGNIGQP